MWMNQTHSKRLKMLEHINVNYNFHNVDQYKWMPNALLSKINFSVEMIQNKKFKILTTGLNTTHNNSLSYKRTLRNRKNFLNKTWKISLFGQTSRHDNDFWKHYRKNNFVKEERRANIQNR